MPAASGAKSPCLHQEAGAGVRQEAGRGRDIGGAGRDIGGAGRDIGGAGVTVGRVMNRGRGQYGGEVGPNRADPNQGARLCLCASVLGTVKVAVRETRLTDVGRQLVDDFEAADARVRH